MMSLHIRCPKDPRHEYFEVTGHVSERWKMDRRGNFCEVLEGGEIVHDPDPGDVWLCMKCGTRAIVTEGDSKT